MKSGTMQEISGMQTSDFSLCPRSGKVLAEKNAQDLYAVAGSCKEQITTLCARSAAGNVIPSMHIFRGQCFGYNSLYQVLILENLHQGGLIQSFLGAACGSPYIVFISTSGM